LIDEITELMIESNKNRFMADIIKEVNSFEQVLYDPSQAIEDCRASTATAYIEYGGLWQTDQLTQMRVLSKWVQASRFTMASALSRNILKDENGKKRRSIPGNLHGALGLSLANYRVWNEWNDYSDRLRSASEIDIAGSQINLNMDRRAIVGDFSPKTIELYQASARAMIVLFFDLVSGDIADGEYNIFANSREFSNLKTSTVERSRDLVNLQSRLDKTSISSIDPGTEAGEEMYQGYFDVAEGFLNLGASLMMPGITNPELLITRTKPPVPTKIPSYKPGATEPSPAPRPEPKIPSYKPGATEPSPAPRPEPKIPSYKPGATEPSPAPRPEPKIPSYKPGATEPSPAPRPEPKIPSYKPGATEPSPAPRPEPKIPSYKPGATEPSPAPRPEPKIPSYKPGATEPSPAPRPEPKIPSYKPGATEPSPAPRPEPKIPSYKPGATEPSPAPRPEPKIPSYKPGATEPSPAPRPEPKIPSYNPNADIGEVLDINSVPGASK
jgi:hypothetical protein